MYIVTRKARRNKGIVRYYVLVETSYIDKKPRQKVVRYLGTAEKIKEIFDTYDRKKKRKR